MVAISPPDSSVRFEFNHEQLTARAIPHEIVFIEWAPPSG